MERLRQPVLAGILAALVGFTGSSAVVLTGLRAVGASPAQAASGLIALCVSQGLGMLWLVRRHRIPLTLAWSTPGAALLAGTGVIHGGWPAAIGAFLVVAALIVATGLWPRLGGLIAAIPAPIAQAMLAGVVFQLCLDPVRGFAAHPWLVGPILLTWVVLLRFARAWAIPAAFAVTLVVVAVVAGRHGGVRGALLPHLDWTTPAITGAGLLSLALPLYVVTMAGQNVPGVAIMSSYGYRVPWREVMTVTGIGTAASALAGGHAVNLAAITASMAASPDADPDPGRRWIASRTAGWAYLVLALLAAALTTFVSAAPADVTGAVAGLALLGTLSASLAAALAAAEGREAAAVTFVAAASGLSFGGIGAAFWALIAGLLVRAVLPRRLPPPGGHLGSGAVATVTDPEPWVRAVRASHDRLSGIVAGLDADGLRRQSYAKEWTIADVLSHLGSGAEIFMLSLNAGLAGAEPPASEDFQPIWATWNARSPQDQAAQCYVANEALVSRLESLSAAERESFSVVMFGAMTMDLAGLLGLRLSEHAVHTWDVAVVGDPAALIAQDAVELLIDRLSMIIGFTAKKSADPVVAAVTTTNPDRSFTLDTGAVSLAPGDPQAAAQASLVLTAEALIRLVYGRLDDAAELTAAGITLPELQAVFPGF